MALTKTIVQLIYVSFFQLLTVVWKLFLKFSQFFYYEYRII